MSLQQFERKSLQEINQSIDVPKGIPFWKTLLLFSGPGSLVAVGYMDPGNWITSVVGGAQYRYLLLSVVLLSSLIAMQLQQMAGKLGIVHRKDLAQTTAHHLPKWLRYTLWICDRACLDGDRFGGSHRLRDCPPPPLWLAFALFLF